MPGNSPSDVLVADGVCAVTTTVATPEDARRLAQAVLQQRLAACVQIEPITSHYRWQGALQNSIFQPPVAVQQFAATVVVDSAFRCQFQRADRTIQQFAAQMFFDRLDDFTRRRLRNIVRFRCFGKTSSQGDFAEQF